MRTCPAAEPDEPRTRRKEELGVMPVLPRFPGNAIAMTVMAMLGLSVLAACTSASRTSSSPVASGRPTTPITIGASLSLTADFSADGPAFAQRSQLWAKAADAHGGSRGR